MPDPREVPDSAAQGAAASGPPSSNLQAQNLQAPPAAPSQKGPVAELLSDAFNLDWRMPRTFWGLLARPRAVAEAYHRRKDAPRDPLVAEKARRYASPFKYVVLAAAVTTFLLALTVDMGEVMRQSTETGMQLAGGEAAMQDLPAQVRKPIQRFNEKVQMIGAKASTRYRALTFLFVYVPALTLVSALFLRNKDERSFTQAFKRHFGPNTYVFAEASLLQIPLLALVPFLGTLTALSLLGALVLVGYALWATTRFYELRGAYGLLKGAVVVAGMYAVAQVILFVLMMSLALFLLWL